MLTAEIANALAAQNDQVITLINRAGDGAELDQVVATFALISPVWVAAEYGYKVAEINHRIGQRAGRLIREERDYLALCRKNDRTRAGTERNIHRLRQLESLAL